MSLCHHRGPVQCDAAGRHRYTLPITKFETPILMPDPEFKAKLPDGAVSARRQAASKRLK